MTSNYYCASHLCRRTTRHVCVRMAKQTYYYCVECGRRLEKISEEIGEVSEAGSLDQRKTA